jgi:hypothetical protein
MREGAHGSRPTDDAIRAMLEERVAHARPISPDIARIVAAAGRRASRPFIPSVLPLPRLAIAGSALVAVLAAAVLLATSFVNVPVGNLPLRSGTTAAASARPSTSSSPAPSDVEPTRLLTPAEAGVLIRTRSAALAGTLVAVDGRLETDPTATCHSEGLCLTATILAGAGGGFTVRPVGDIGPGPWDGSGPLEGALILRLRVPLGLTIVDFVGVLRTPSTVGPAWSVADIIGGAAHVEGSYVAVDGWLVRGPLHPCPSINQSSGLSYGCPSDDWVTDAPFQPLQPDGSSIGSSDGLYLLSGSYDRWAPGPASYGPGSVGVEPRHATYLLWLISDGCGPNADCATPRPQWRIVGRFDPVPPGRAIPPPNPAFPPPGVEPPPSGAAWTVSQLREANWPVVTQRMFVVRGWLVATPPLRCVARPIPSGLPDYGCDERDWLTDVPFQPWTSDGTNGSAHDPAVGLRVQNGAYQAFAPDPAITAGGRREPRLGTYVVRFSVHGACEYATIRGPCAGGLLFTWEIVDR